MKRFLFLGGISVLTAICLIGCAQPQGTHNRVCVKTAKKNLKDTTKYFNSRATKSGKESVVVHCQCLSRGLATILSPEQYDKMEDLMGKASGDAAFDIRNNYLKSLVPRGTRFKDRPFETVRSSCKQYMKVWRNSSSMRDVYTPPPPY